MSVVPSGNRSRFGIRGVLAAVLAVLLAAVFTQQAVVRMGMDSAGAESALPVPAVGAILLLVGINALIARWRRGVGLLSRSQLVLVAACALIAGPLLTQGFWHRFLGTVTTFPRMQEFALIDALPDKLWPHGANLLADMLPKDPPRAVDSEHPLELTVPVGLAADRPGEPCLLSVLVQAPNLPSGTVLTCTLAGEDGATRVEAIRLDQPTKPDQIRGDGFQRLGVYGLRLPEATGSVRVRFEMSGPGSAQVADGKLMSVAAVEGLLRGRTPVTAEVYERLTPEQQAASVIVPVNRFSAEGLAFVAGGGVPWRQWGVCLAAWASFLVLLMGAIHGLTLLLHKQWIEAERLPLPLARGTGMLLGLDIVSIWRSRWFWGGLVVATAWCQMRYWAGHNSSIPDPSVSVALKPYLNDPSWGRMWEVTFSVHALFLGLALFAELNILFSVVLGYFLFRSMYWTGYAAGYGGLGEDAAVFPWRFDLCVGAFFAYFVVVMLLARRHLLRSVRRGLTGGWRREEGEAASPRVALLLLGGCCIGAALWCWWIGTGSAGFAILFAALLVVGVVAARLRAECGVVFGYFTPYQFTIVLAGLGGVSVFGPQVVLFGLLASMWMATCTMHIPGMQVDMAELGRREGTGQGAILGVPLLGILLGVFVGGWAFLSLGYGQGGNNLSFAWAFDTKEWYFPGFRNEVMNPARASAVSPWGVSAGAAATALVAAIRHVVPGFWLHPVGLLLGPTHMMDAVWGSCLVALVARFAVVKMAGAQAVRNRLLPIGLGLFLAAALTYLTAFVHGSLLTEAAASGELLRGIP